MELRKERVDRGIKARSETIFVLTSWKEMAYFAGPRVFPVVSLFVLYFLVSVYWQRVLMNAGVFALLGISWVFLVNCGMVSLGQALFFGVGAYITGCLNYYFNCPPLITIFLGTLFGGLLCTIFLYPTLRLRGIYFAMVTLALPLLFERLIESTSILGGTQGLSGLTPLPNNWVAVMLSFTSLWATYFLLRRMIDSNFGTVLRSIKDNDQSVTNSGINIYWFKAEGLFVASSIGAFCGAFLTHAYQFVGMPAFAFDYSIVPIAVVIVGGSGSFSGAVLGAFILVPLSELLRGTGGLRMVLYCLFLTFFVLALPEGIFPFIRRKYCQFERWVEIDR
jgi:branched-chain amino acid transport system permease protein